MTRILKLSKGSVFMKKIKLTKIISIVLILGMILSFCGCKKMTSTESNFSSGYSTTSDFVSSDDYVEQYYTLTQPDGTKVIVNENQEVIENATINEDGSVTITDKDTGKTTNISTNDIKDFDTTIGEDDTTSSVTSSTSSKVETTKPSTDNKKPTTSNNVSSAVSTPTTSTNVPSSNPTTSNSTTTSSETSSSTELTPLTASEIKQVEDYFFKLVNEERARVGVQPLTRNSTLDKAANIRVNELLKEYSHTRPTGEQYFTVLTELKYGTPHEDIWSDDGINWNTSISYDFGASGENLAGDYNTSKRTLQEIANSFFTNFRYSAGHYQNMINGNFNYTGISVNSYIDNNVFKCDIIHIFTEQ